jgi:glyoxylase-like metal-dependent hydrolase (beta-lactamase superfamily II)
MEPRTRHLIAVDVGEFETSHKVISEIEKTHKTELRYILSTHHHDDHVGGNLKWKETRPNI